MVYYNPYKNWVYNPLYTLNNQVFFMAHMSSYGFCKGLTESWNHELWSVHSHAMDKLKFDMITAKNPNSFWIS